MRVAVISAVYGGYDIPKEHAPQDADAEWLFVTGEPVDVPEPWRNVVHPAPHLSPRMASKVPKCRPDWFTDADYVIWIDGSFRIAWHGFVRWCIEQLGDGLIAQIRHPERESLTDEANVASMYSKYAGFDLNRQVAYYRNAGHPDRWGLWASGLVVYRMCPEVVEFGGRWLLEQLRWGVMCQLSEPPLLRDLGITPVDLETGLWKSPMFSIAAHRDDQ